MTVMKKIMPFCLFLMIILFASCSAKKDENPADFSEPTSYTLYNYDEPCTTQYHSYEDITDSVNTYSETANEKTAPVYPSYTTYAAYTTQTTVGTKTTKAAATVRTTAVPTTVKTTAKTTVPTTVKTTINTTVPTTVKTTVRTTLPTTVRTTVPTTTAHSHNYISSVTTEATCTRNGVRTYKCSACSHTYTESIPTADHNYIPSVVAPTCTESGYTLNTCSNCSHSYKSNTVNPSGHSYQAIKTVEPTKTSDGYTVYTCSVCSHSYEGDKKLYVPTEQEAYDSIMALKSSYPDGTPWDNSDYYSWRGGIYTTGYGCAGFAFMLSDAAFGKLPARKTTDLSNIRTGDILRINNDSHSVVVLEVKDDGVIVAEGNLNSQVYWGRKIPLSVVHAPGTYILTRYPE